jgi:hypothetical protein
MPRNNVYCSIHAYEVEPRLEWKTPIRPEAPRLRGWRLAGFWLSAIVVGWGCALAGIYGLYYAYEFFQWLSTVSL